VYSRALDHNHNLSILDSLTRPNTFSSTDISPCSAKLMDPTLAKKFLAIVNEGIDFPLVVDSKSYPVLLEFNLDAMIALRA
jgi:hypothetical protein